MNRNYWFYLEDRFRHFLRLHYQKCPAKCNFKCLQPYKVSLNFIASKINDYTECPSNVAEFVSIKDTTNETLSKLSFALIENIVYSSMTSVDTECEIVGFIYRWLQCQIESRDLGKLEKRLTEGIRWSHIESRAVDIRPRTYLGA